MKTIGVMLDCSRNAVRNVASLKKFIDYSKKMNLNRLYLYIEDIYEIDGEPYFGHLRGRYSTKELKEVADYGNNVGVEVVPCFQTLAHLNGIFSWNRFDEINDIDDVLLCGDEKTYELIDKMFATLGKVFTCKNYNVGMDEAFYMGHGKYLQKNGWQPKLDIFMNHLAKVNEIAHKYGKTISIWSDMLYKSSLNINFYYDTKVKFNKEFVDRIPKDVTLIYWDYYSTDFSTYDRMMSNHISIENPVSFATGIWSWTGFAPSNTFAFKILKNGMKAASKYDIEDVVITAWGDNGGECAMFSSLPAIFYASELARGITSMSKIKDDFYKALGFKFDDFMKLDLPNLLSKDNVHVNPSKYLTFNDPFIGVHDCSLKGDENEKYAGIYRKIKSSGKRMGEFSYLTNYMASLAKFLSIKACLGLKTREAYNAKDFEKIKEIIPQYKLAAKYLKVFIEDFKKAWFTENKTLGFEIQEFRLGGLLLRIEECAKELVKFVNHEIDFIEELDQPLLDLDCSKGKDLSKKEELVNNYKFSSSKNTF